MGSKGIEKNWVIMTEKRSIYATEQEWNLARKIMQQKMASGETPPFKIQNDNQQLNHSFLVAKGENDQPILGVLARSRDQAEGILGFGSFGMCKLIVWEDGTKNAVKIEAEKNDQNEIAIMTKLGLIRALFKRSWEKRLAEHPNKTQVNEQWISKSAIRNKIYKIMPLIEGIDINKYLSSVYLPKPFVGSLVIFSSIVDKLIEIHAQNILHNDLHPGNVLVDANLNAYIIDNGKSIDVEHKPITVKDNFNCLGQIARLAPELMAFRNKTLADRAKDPSSVMNTTEMPFSTASDVFALSFIFSQLFYPLLTEQALQELMSGMREADPNKRISLQKISAMIKSTDFIEKMRSYDQNSNFEGPALEENYTEQTDNSENATSDSLSYSSDETNQHQTEFSGYDESISSDKAKPNNKLKT
ncbi:MAG: protein kinase [Candidatus Berkiella sp.]